MSSLNVQTDTKSDITKQLACRGSLLLFPVNLLNDSGFLFLAIPTRTYSSYKLELIFRRMVQNNSNCIDQLSDQSGQKIDTMLGALTPSASDLVSLPLSFRWHS